MAELGFNGQDWPAKLIVWVIICFVKQLLKLLTANLPKNNCSGQFFVGETDLS